MTIEAGSTLGPYRIVERIGSGGMATVYKGYQASLGRHVALKVLPAFYAEDPGFRERFRQEALAVAQLRHPNILAVYDYGEENGVHYIVGEHVGGGTLAERLGDPMPVDRAVILLRPVAAALDHAHARGMVHRDVKPSNVLLATDGTPILSDFGLAKILGTLPRLTQTGTAMGTPEYMSPEVATGISAGPGADQYALGVIAYEMLTGRVPFTADTPLAVLLAHAHNPLPLPRTIEPSIPPKVEEVLLKVLAKSPSDRYPDCSRFVAALEHAASTAAVGASDAPTQAALLPPPALATAAPPVATPSTPSATLAPPLRRRPTRWIVGGAAGAVAVAAAITAGAVLVSPRAASPAVPSPPSASPSARPTSSLAQGKMLFQAKLDAAGSDIARTNVDGDRAVQVARPSAGAIDLTAKSPGGLDLILVYSPPLRYSAEAALVLKDATGGFKTDWIVVQGKSSQVFVTVEPQTETMRLWLGDTTTDPKGQFTALTAKVDVRGMLSGRAFTVGVVIDAPRYTVFLDGVEVGSGSADVPGRDAAPLHFRACCGAPGSGGTIAITDVRVYALP